MLTVVKTPKALEDLAGIALYIAQHRPAAALRFLDQAERTFQMLSITPLIGQRLSYETDATTGFRVRTIIGFRNYIVYYRPRGSALEIARVVYGGRDQGPLVDDLLKE
jgi:toxin ParE1/3/4